MESAQPAGGAVLHNHELIAYTGDLASNEAIFAFVAPYLHILTPPPHLPAESA